MRAGRQNTGLSRLRALAVIGVLVLFMISIGMFGIVIGDLLEAENDASDEEMDDQSPSEQPEDGGTGDTDPGGNNTAESDTDQQTGTLSTAGHPHGGSTGGFPV